MYLVHDFVPVEVIDPAKRLRLTVGKGVKKEVIDPKAGAAAGATNPFAEGQFFARPGVAKALERYRHYLLIEAGMIGQLYQSLSFISKRFITNSKNNFITSTRMLETLLVLVLFATANGIIPDGASYQDKRIKHYKHH